MEDSLKKYTEDHRDELDLYQPREHLWKEIDARMQHNHKGRLWQLTAIAASVLLIITCSTWFYINSRKETRATATAAPAQIMETEAYFAAIVQMKDAEMEQYCQPQPELCRAFETDIAELNTAYHQLKKEYAVAADKKAILQAMMNNLNMQVQLINRQLQIMQTVKQKKEQVRMI